VTRPRAALLAALLAAAFAVQFYFLRAYPQPILFGDPAGYLTVGQRLLEALSDWRGGQAFAEAFEPVRLLLPLLGVGAAFAALEAARPGDLAFFRVAMAAANTLGMLGAFLLARRLGGTFAAGVAAVVLAALHPSYSVQTGRLYPDPVTSCLFVWAAWLFVEGLDRWRARWFLAAGFTLAAGLFVRSQLLEFIPGLAALALLASAPRWWRVPGARRMVCALVLGALPFLAGWMAIQRAVGGNLDAVDQLGNFTFRQRYPYGFWQFLETDGWIGPYRLKSEPYYKALEAAAAGDPDLLRDRGRQLAFTARYVAARPVESALLVLDNAYRLHDRPPNDYKWDYPYPYAAQVVVHRAILVLSLAAVALFTAERPARGGAFLIPLALTALHGLAFPWPRYAQPALLILIAAASGLAGWIAARWRASPAAPGKPVAARHARVLAAVSIAAAVAALAAAGPFPRAAHVLRIASVLALAAVPFALASALSAAPAARRLLIAAFGVLAVLVTAHAARDRRWHEVRAWIAGGAAIEQEIDLTPEAVGRLRAAGEAFVVFDLEVPAGDLQGAVVTVAGRDHPGSALLPTMPKLRESTATGRRDRRAYPQWWALPFDPALLPRDAAPLRIALRLPPDRRAAIAGDRFSGQGRVYEGPSFGDWPRFVALKLEYDGDYRLAVREPLGSAATRSFVTEADGARRAVGAVHRVRVITIGQNEGSAEWETAPVPSSPMSVAWAAWSGTRGEAELAVDGRAVLRFPLGATWPFESEGGGYRLCHVPEGIRGEKPYGAYTLSGPAEAGRPAALRVRFRTGMAHEPLFYVVDAKNAPAASAIGRCGPASTPGAARILDATRNNYPEDTGRWTVTGVF
jgi:hypothetical protein